jgi:limonene-1,2-epoxide hydrolase
MTNPTLVVDDFMRAVREGRLPEARARLADDLVFQGPFDSFDDPESYLTALRRLQPIIKGVRIEKVFQDGEDVCVLYTMETNTVIGSALICEWFKVLGDRICSIRAVFDARPFAPMFSK